MNAIGRLLRDARDEGAAQAELAILARERRSFPTRQEMYDELVAIVPEEIRERVRALGLGLLGAADDDGAEPMARCKQCGHIFDLPVLICECPRPECKSRYIERVVI